MGRDWMDTKHRLRCQAESRDLPGTRAGGLPTYSASLAKGFHFNYLHVAALTARGISTATCRLVGCNMAYHGASGL